MTYAISQIPRLLHLNLEATRTSAATSTLELAALGDNMGFLVLVRAEAEVLDGLTAVLGAAENKGVAASGSSESELVERNGLATGGNNACTGGSGESQSSDGQLREGEQAVVIGDGTDNDDGTFLALLVDVGNDAGQRYGRAVDLGHKEASKNNLVEGRVGTASQEAIELYQELEIDIVTLGRLTVSRANVVAVEIDTYRKKPIVSLLF